MATKHQKREEYSSSNVIRVLNSGGTISPNNNVSHLDNNLDYLLEDLQSSVSPVGYTSSSRDVQYLSPANSTTVLKERSISPGSDGRRVYKTSSYQYSSSSGDASNTQQNVNQLDTLLQDLKSERERDYSHISNVGIDSGLLEPTSNVTKTTHVYKSSMAGGKPHVKRELVFDTQNDNLLRSTSPNSGANYVKKIETKTVKDVSYDPVSRYDVQTTEEKLLVPQPSTITLESTTLPAELKNVHLSDDILPVPGTKVTTTVRTYTYEIPAEPTSTLNKTLLYKNESYNSSSTSHPERNIPQSVVFKTESYNTIDRTDGGGGGGRPVSPSIQNSTTKVLHKRDVRETTTSSYPPSGQDYPTVRSPPPSNTTVVYKQDVTNTTNKNVWNPNYPVDQAPPHQPHQPNQPGTGPSTTYYYKHESSNTKNTLYGPPGGGSPYPPNDNAPYIQYPNDSKPYPYPGEPNKPSVVTYKYSTHTSTTNTHGSPGEREPLLQPAPFPTDSVDHSSTNGNPPKRLDDLMATFNGNASGRPESDDTIARRREVNTSIATQGEPKIPSKNVAGPPVYYPPGHEMFVRKEESSAAYRAQGGYAKASGRYEYEAESKSKSKSRSGAAVVPVCLPLCCAMPCSIM